MSIGSAGRHGSQVRSARLLRSKKHRSEQRCFLIEGTQLVEAAFAAGTPLRAAFVAGRAQEPTKALAERLARAGVPVAAVGESTIESLSQARSPQPIVAVAPFVERQAPELAVLLADERTAAVFVLHDLSDPGNVGTLIRCAEAFRVAAVCCGPHCAEPYNQKVVRATAGALFRVPIIRYAQWSTIADILRTCNVAIVAADARGTDVRSTDMARRCALVIGHERHGLTALPSQEIKARVAVPHIRAVDSLNAGVAGAILMYEIARKLTLIGEREDGR